MSIFINYRKDDSRWNTQALYNGLLKYFPREAIFKDFNNIQPGEDFVESINKALEECRVLLVVISKHWLITTNADGKNRLDDPEDFVRIEIATALKRNVRVIPVLFDNIEMPRAEVLPEDLKLLTRRQFISISDTRFDNDLHTLAEAIKRVDAKKDTPQPIFETSPPVIVEEEIVEPKIKASSPRSRAWVAVRSGLIAASLPLLIILVSPKSKEEWNFFDINAALICAAVIAILWACIGAMANANKKMRAIAILSFFISLIIFLYNSGPFDGIKFLDTVLFILVGSLGSALTVFIAWLYKKISA